MDTLIQKLQLGVVYDAEGKIRNHRSLVNVVLNPFLRLVGLNIGTVYVPSKNELYGNRLFWIKDPPFRVNRCVSNLFGYELPDGWRIEKKRMWM